MSQESEPKVTGEKAAPELRLVRSPEDADLTTASIGKSTSGNDPQQTASALQELNPQTDTILERSSITAGGLNLTGSGELDREYCGELFNKNTSAEGTYKFNARGLGAERAERVSMVAQSMREHFNAELATRGLSGYAAPYNELVDQAAAIDTGLRHIEMLAKTGMVKLARGERPEPVDNVDFNREGPANPEVAEAKIRAFVAGYFPGMAA